MGSDLCPEGSNPWRVIHAEPGNRSNNLNLLRLVAAYAVLISHAWPIVHGPGTEEPLKAATGYTLGTIAVMVFFGLSGFLITASWQRSPAPWRFLARRAQRLLPGLWVVLLLSAAVMGPLVGTMPLSDYLSDPGFWKFLLRNALVLPIEPELPGVFVDNPYPAAAGSIWTLHYEALCYAGVMAAGLAGLLQKRLAPWFLGAAILVATATLDAGPAVHPRLSEPCAPWPAISIGDGRLPLARQAAPYSADVCCAARTCLDRGRHDGVPATFHRRTCLYFALAGLRALPCRAGLEPGWRLFLWRLSLRLSHAGTGTASLVARDGRGTYCNRNLAGPGLGSPLMASGRTALASRRLG